MKQKIVKIKNFILYRSTITGEFITTYSWVDIFRIIRDVIFSRLFLNLNIRRIKLPFHIIGKRYIQFSKSFTAGKNLRIEVKKTVSATKDPSLFFGENVKMNDYVHIGCIDDVYIGNNVLIGSNVLIIDHNHGRYGDDDEAHDSPLVPPDERKASSRKVVIHNNVWIGEYVSVLPGAEIGEGSIVASMSVINKKIPKNCIVAGAPARIIKKYNETTKRWERYQA